MQYTPNTYITNYDWLPIAQKKIVFYSFYVSKLGK